MKLLKNILLLVLQNSIFFGGEPSPVLTIGQIAAEREIQLLLEALQRQGILGNNLRLLDLISQELASLHTKDCYHKQK